MGGLGSSGLRAFRGREIGLNSAMVVQIGNGSFRRLVLVPDAYRAVLGFRVRWIGWACLALGCVASPDSSLAQLETDSPLTQAAATSYGVSIGTPQIVRYQIGANIKTAGGSFSGVSIRLPVPADWPEQRVAVIDEEIYDRAGKISYRVLDSGVKQMMVSIAQVPANTEAKVVITYEVAISPILAPQQTAGLTKPKRITKELKFFIGDGPLIFPRDRELKKQVEQLTTQEQEPWEALQLLHRFIMDHVTETVSKPQSTVETLKNKQGCNEDRAALFVAFARSLQIPARMVMVEGGQHAEFCLEDPAGNAHWYPCTFRGSGEFGSWSRPAVVFQKGDNIKEPESTQRVRLIPEMINGKGTVPPQVQTIRRVVQS
jgi:hypothetical protein